MNFGRARASGGRNGNASRCWFMVSIIVVLGAGCGGASRPTSDEAIDELAREVSSELRCPVCQGLSIQDSPTELAQGMRGVVRDKLAQGQTPEEVKAYFVGRYGEWILMRPRASGFNLLVYVLPVLGLAAGGALVFALTRRWTRARTWQDPQSSGLPDESDPDLAAWNALRGP